jgi:hypothetical protein
MAGGKFREGMIANIKEDMRKGANSPGGRGLNKKNIICFIKNIFYILEVFLL